MGSGFKEAQDRERGVPVQQGSVGSNLERTLGIIRRRWFWMPLCLVLGAGAAFAISKHQTKTYTATALLLFRGNEFSQEIAGLSSNISPQAGQNNDLKLVASGNVVATTASALGKGLTPQQIGESLSISEQGESSFTGESSVVAVSASTASRSLAAEIANTYVSEFVKEQRISNRRYFKAAATLVDKQLAAIPSAQRFSTAAVDLQNRAESLSLLAELQYDGVKVGRPALTPTGPSSPRAKRDTIIGGALGLLVGIGLIFLLEHLDHRIREPEDLAKLYSVPLLGIVRESQSIARNSQGDGSTWTALPPAEAETFSMIFAHLRSRDTDGHLRAILITSAAPGDGNTTIALYLAAAATRTGARVLLLEANLRRPTLARQLGLQPRPGLSEVLTGNIPMGEATQSVALAAPSSDGVTTRTLDVLAAGNVYPSGPGELIEGDAMDAVLEGARAKYDLVIVDTPPLTAVSDAFPLLRRVDGIVIVGAIGRDRSDIAERLRQTLDNSSALLGVVANRSGFRSRDFVAYDPVEVTDSSQPGSSDNGVSSPTQPRSTVST